MSADVVFDDEEGDGNFRGPQEGVICFDVIVTPL